MTKLYTYGKVLSGYASPQEDTYVRFENVVLQKGVLVPNHTTPNVMVSEEVWDTAQQIVQFLRDAVASVNIVMEGEFSAPGHKCHYADELLRIIDRMAIKPERFHISYPRHRGNNSYVIVITREVIDKSVPASAA